MPHDRHLAAAPVRPAVRRHGAPHGGRRLVSRDPAPARQPGAAGGNRCRRRDQHPARRAASAPNRQRLLVAIVQWHRGDAHMSIRMHSKTRLPSGSGQAKRACEPTPRAAQASPVRHEDTYPYESLRTGPVCALANPRFCRMDHGRCACSQLTASASYRCILDACWSGAGWSGATHTPGVVTSRAHVAY